MLLNVQERLLWPSDRASVVFRCCGSRADALFWLLPLALTAGVLALSTLTIGSDRLLYHWPISITAFAASVVAGVSPDGGSSVFYPVLTLVLHAPPSVGRTFSMCIQALGMGVASLRIMLTQTRVDWKVIAISLPPGIATEVLWLFRRDVSDPARAAFWPPLVPGPSIQVTFILVLTSMAFLSCVMLWTSEHSSRHLSVTPWNARRVVALALAGAAGGVLCAWSATGANLLVYLLCVAGFDLSAKVAVPTTILITTAGLVCGVGTFVILLIRMAINFGTKVRVCVSKRGKERARARAHTHTHTHTTYTHKNTHRAAATRCSSRTFTSCKSSVTSSLAS